MVAKNILMIVGDYVEDYEVIDIIFQLNEGLVNRITIIKC